MGEYDNIKHAYIGSTNIKSIYKGSELQWREPSSEPVTVWRAVRRTVDDNPSVGDEYVFVLRPSSGTYSGRYLPMSSYENSVTVLGQKIYFLFPFTSNPMTLRYRYDVFGSDGLRLCHYLADWDLDIGQYCSFRVDSLKSGLTRYMRLRKRDGGDNTWLRSTSATGIGIHIMDLDSSANSGWFSRRAVSGWYESDVQDTPNIDESWASPYTDIYSSNSVYGNFGTYSNKNYVTWGNDSSGHGYCYIFKKVTAYL